MRSVAFINLEIRLEQDADDGYGIAADAEEIFDACEYFGSGSASDALSGIEDLLRDAIKACERRAGVAS